MVYCKKYSNKPLTYCRFGTNPADCVDTERKSGRSKVNASESERKTREKIVALLWRSPRTVGELAAGLGLTGNAVRSHLQRLEAEGMVRKSGMRQMRRKPAVEYACTPAADSMLPKAYAGAMASVIAEMEGELGESGMEAVLGRSGERLANGYRGRFAGLTRAQRMVELSGLLRELGGVGDVEGTGDQAYVVHGHVCPLQNVVDRQPAACEIVRSLIDGVLGDAEVRQCCRHEGASHCRFEVRFAGADDREGRPAR